MELDKDNANPTILNPSDLPSRRRESAVTQRTGLFDRLIPCFSDPFDEPVSPPDSDDAAEEIDEQEIYGMLHTCFIRDFQGLSRAW